jgi:hypothetical protein
MYLGGKKTASVVPPPFRLLLIAIALPDAYTGTSVK